MIYKYKWINHKSLDKLIILFNQPKKKIKSQYPTLGTFYSYKFYINIKIKFLLIIKTTAIENKKKFLTNKQNINCYSTNNVSCAIICFFYKKRKLYLIGCYTHKQIRDRHFFLIKPKLYEHFVLTKTGTNI